VFTGITRGAFPVVATERTPDLLRYEVALNETLAHGLLLGASVSIDGVCQTVVQTRGTVAVFEAIRETLDRTTLGELRPGARVNVERSVRAGDEIGGHDVAGHVWGTGEILERRRQGDVFDLKVGVPAAWMRLIFEKGFVALHGSSLTVGANDPAGWFMVHLIPETLRLTTLGDKAVGDRLNVEPDARTVAIVETVERVLARRGLEV
jgi:riboflavin synthase